MSGNIEGFVLAMLLAAACGGGAADTGGPADAAEAGPGALDSAAETTPDPVTWREDLSATWACTNPGTCTRDYERFIELAAAWERPIPEGAVAERLAAIDSGEVPLVPGPPAEGELRAAVVDALNVGFLLDGLGERPLVVTERARTSRPGAVERHLLLEDPWVGTFEVILLVPEGPGPFPAVVALHGHGDTAETYRDDYNGAEYPARGYAIAMPTLRAMDSGVAALDEHRIASALLARGFTLMGLRVYEALLCLKVLRHLPSVDAARVGLIGHSGGSSTGNLVVRLGAGFAAYVSDHRVDWAEWMPAFAVVHCETVPDLYPYSALLDDFSTCATPVLTVPYKYTDGMDPIFAFFGTHLAARPGAP